VLVTSATALLLLVPARSPLEGDWLVPILGLLTVLSILHVVVIGVVNLKLPLQITPAPTQVRGRWARTLSRRGNEPPDATSPP
jgi:hypothetical protein